MAADKTDMVTSDFYKGWYLECIDVSCPGEAFGLKVTEGGGVLKTIKSPYQDIMILKTLVFQRRSNNS